MDIFKAFWVGGIICVIGQILIDKTKLQPGRILVMYVCIGCVLGALDFISRLWIMPEPEQLFRLPALDITCEGCYRRGRLKRLSRNIYRRIKSRRRRNIGCSCVFMACGCVLRAEGKIEDYPNADMYKICLIYMFI